jgi:probable rRNA maturation factor
MVLATGEGVRIKKLHYSFVSREIIQEINQEHLSHDYETDVITFDYSEGNIIVGEVFLCPSVILENSKSLAVSFEEELLRVVLHGLLHLIGYDDQTPDQISAMREKEDEYVKKVLAI